MAVSTSEVERAQTVPPAKAGTGIQGFDEVTGGGLPRGRATLVTGGAGSGKTLFGIEFLVRGAREFGEAGVLMCFEESAAELATNVCSLGFDLPALEREGLLVVDAIRIDATNSAASGSFDLDGLLIRLSSAIEAVGAKRVVLDTIEVLFTALSDPATVRAELGRLLGGLKELGLTVVITGERGRAGELTRFGIEEYVSDCVVVLDNRTQDEMSTRRLRIQKYRGSVHGSNEYPFLIGQSGLVVLPLSSMGLDYGAVTERVSTGIERLDHMLGGGPYRGSTILVTGAPGTGKTSIAACAAEAACARGERAVFISFEESPAQLARNMASIGIDLGRWVAAGLLRLEGVRPSAYGLEEHLVRLHQVPEETDPALVVLDAMGSLHHLGTEAGVSSAFARQLDMIKARGITAVITTLFGSGGEGEIRESAASSLVDTWLLLRSQELNGERNRLLFVIKSRGMAHSNQVREFVLTDRGAELMDVYTGPDGVLTGSARMAQLGEERAAERAQDAEVERRRKALARRTARVEQQIATLREDLAGEAAELEQLGFDDDTTDTARDTDRESMATHRWADTRAAPTNGRAGS
jgi:circadian clock protein KaiC